MDLELRVRRARQPLTDAWRTVPIEPRGATLLGVSFRPPQIDTLGLDLESTFAKLVAYPFQMIRLGAYWNRIEPAPGVFDTRELDWLVEVAERAAKRIVLCVGPLKTFGYPEFFVPNHRLPSALPEHTLITPSAYGSLLDAATEFAARIVDRYKHHAGIIAWQVEHEAVDPLGMEHSWRLAEAFVAREVAAVRQADPSRPILMNGFLPATLPVRLTQWFQTRDQGDSLSVAQRHADILGIDYYPRHALAAVGATTLYLDGSRSPWHGARRAQLFNWARTTHRQLMVTEGQAEPWEAVTTPPNPRAQGMYSCLPEQIIGTYNQWLRWSRQAESALDAYLFWGAEYWLLRQQSGDSSYVGAFARVLEHA
jgi:beta-galactosidase GanA